MFMIDGQLDESDAEWCIDTPIAFIGGSQDQPETDDAYQNLLNAVDAARAGLASDENDFDYLVDETTG